MASFESSRWGETANRNLDEMGNHKNEPGKTSRDAEGPLRRSPSTLLEGFSRVSAGRGRNVSRRAFLSAQTSHFDCVVMRRNINAGSPFVADSCSGRAVPFRSDAPELRLPSPADCAAAVGIQIRYVVVVLTQFKGYK